MKHKKLKTTEIVEKFEQWTTCDVCHKKIQDKFIITECQTHACFPEGSWDYLKIDICHDCFKNKLVPTLEKHLGIKFQELYDWDEEPYIKEKENGEEN